MALVASLFVTMLLTSLGMSLVLLASTGTALAARDRQAADTARAADAVLRLAISELRERVDWTGAIAAGSVDVCAGPGRFVDTSLFPRAAWDGSVVDLHALTQELQAAADAGAPPGTSAPVWRLFEYGPISRLIPSNPGRHPFYVAVWAADGRGGLLSLHATGLGPGGSRASVEASVTRPGGGPMVRLAIRSVP